MARTPYLRYVRHRAYRRLRHSNYTQVWLDEQATRLGMTSQELWEDLLVEQKMTAVQVEAIPTPPEPAAPTVTTAAAITGTPTVGQTLTQSGAAFDGEPTPTVTYQWQADAVDIASATTTAYLLTSAEETKTITCIVTATNSEGTVSSTSNALGPVAAA